MLTTFALDNYVYESLRAGASGFMVKDAPPEEIAAAVRIVANGEALLAPSVTRTVIEEFARHPTPPPDQTPFAVTLLTPRERELLQLFAEGNLQRAGHTTRGRRKGQLRVVFRVGERERIALEQCHGMAV